jgi:hypothetical protein
MLIILDIRCKKIIPLNAVKAFWGSGGMPQCIPELGTKWLHDFGRLTPGKALPIRTSYAGQK